MTRKRSFNAAIGGAGALLLAACASGPPAPEAATFGATSDAPSTSPALAPRPVFPGYGAAVARQTIPWTVDSLVADFIELNFETEGDASYERLHRWEGPVRIAYEGDRLAAFETDLKRLIALLNEAAPGLRAALTASDAADIRIRTAPERDMKEIDATALCFFSPVDMSWREFKRAEAQGEARWEDVERLENVTIFIPENASPHTFRICFIEEIMQALGPSNDLYLLEDSGFNDDEVHKAPTAFDLLMIRTLYDEAMRPGATREEAARIARAVIADALAPSRAKRIERRRSPIDEEFQLYHYASDFIDDVSDRRAVVEYTLDLAARLDGDDHRIGEAYRTAALLQAELGDTALAVTYAMRAEAHFARTLPETSARLARMRSDLGYLLMIDDQMEAAPPLLRAAAPVLAANEMDEKLASTLRLTAIALAASGDAKAAAPVARQALDWGAYVYGPRAADLLRWRKEFKDFGIDV